MKLLLVFTLLTLCFACAANAQDGNTLFNIRPAIAEKVVASLHGVDCFFSYSAVGGSSEVWQLQVKQSDEGGYTCVIARPDQASYLFFQSWSAVVVGGTLSGVLVVDGDFSNMLEHDAWVYANGQSVSNAPSWQGVVGGIQLDIEKK
jgi:UPF0556 domain